MFTWLNKQGVRSDSGFEVQFTSRFDAEYRENGQIISLYVESGVTGGIPSIIIEPDAFVRWDDGKNIAPERQATILKNFIAAMEFQGLKTVVEKGE